MRVTIFGVSGLLGQALMREWSGDEISGLTSRDADIRDPDQVRRARDKGISGLDCAGGRIHRRGRLREQAERAFSVNRDGAVNVAKRGKRLAAAAVLEFRLCLRREKTTPYEIDDSRNPQSVYGRSKAEAEVQLLEILPTSASSAPRGCSELEGNAFQIRF